MVHHRCNRQFMAHHLKYQMNIKWHRMKYPMNNGHSVHQTTVHKSKIYKFSAKKHICVLISNSIVLSTVWSFRKGFTAMVIVFTWNRAVDIWVQHLKSFWTAAVCQAQPITMHNSSVHQLHRAAMLKTQSSSNTIRTCKKFGIRYVSKTLSYITLEYSIRYDSLITTV